MLAAQWPHQLVLGPVSTSPPWPVGHDLGGEDALRDEWWGFRLTVATACLGLPAVSVPVGFDTHGLPVGVQLIGPRWAEARCSRPRSDREVDLMRRERPAIFSGLPIPRFNTGLA